jgi:hypothetical protein
MENSDYNPIINNVDDFVSFLDVRPNQEYIVEKEDDYLEIQFLNDLDDFAIEVRYLGEDNGKKYYIGKGVSYTYSMYYKIFSFQNNSFKNEVNINEILKNENIDYADYSSVENILIDELKRPHTLIMDFSSGGSGSWNMDLLIFNYIENEFILTKRISGNSINSSLKQTEDKIMLKVEMYKPLRYVNKIQGRASTAAQYDMLGGNMKIISLYHFDNESKEYVLKERKTEMNEYGLVNQYLLALDYPYGENLSDSYSYYYNESESLKIKNIVKVRKNTDLLEFILNEELDKIIKVNYLKNYFGPSNDEGKKWSFETEGYIGSSPAIGSDGTIYVGSGHSLYAINPDGTEKWSFEVDRNISSSPAIGQDGTIYVGGSGRVYAINPDGTKKWSFETGGNVESSPAIGSDGTIYVGSGDGKLYAIEGNSGGLADSPWPKFGKNNRNTGNYNDLE